MGVSVFEATSFGFTRKPEREHHHFEGPLKRRADIVVKLHTYVSPSGQLGLVPMNRRFETRKEACERVESETLLVALVATILLKWSWRNRQLASNPGCKNLRRACKGKGELGPLRQLGHHLRLESSWFRPGKDNF